MMDYDIVFLFSEMGEFDQCPYVCISSSDYFKFLPQVGYIFNKDFFDTRWNDLITCEQGNYGYFDNFNNFEVIKIEISYDYRVPFETGKSEQKVKYVINLIPVQKSIK